MQLDERKLSILKAIIDDYIMTATPVGSRTISKRQGIGLSSATIRNEMSDLEELGYLEQPHTSAGRIPSDKAYRLYVNNILVRTPLSQAEQAAIQAHFTRRLDEVEDVVKQTAWVLSNVTHYTSLVLAPQLHAARLRHIQLVPLTEDKALAVVVTDAGMTQDSVIRVPADLDARGLEKLSRMLTERFYDMRIDKIAASMGSLLQEQLGAHKELLDSLLEALQRRGAARNVELAGANNVLNHPEYYDLDRARSFLAAIEAKDYLYQRLLNAAKLEFTVTIGNENPKPDMKDLSLVTVTYRIGEEPLGTLGVIGPTRMDYNRVLSILSYVGESLSQTLTNLIEEERR